MITASIRFNKKKDPRKIRIVQYSAGRAGDEFCFIKLYTMTVQLSSVRIWKVARNASPMLSKEPTPN